jgi:diadenylate cyclase
MVFEATVGLREHYENVARINSDISEELILTIFFKDTMLHDGAMIIKGSKIVCASVWLPLSQNQNLDKNFGTRHRAGLGISEVSDALVLIVSEERGEISICQNGVLRKDIGRPVIEDALKAYFSLAQWHQLREKELKEEYS